MHKRRGSIILILILIILGSSYAQTTDLARAEYMYVPLANSKSSVSRFRGILQIPIPLDKEFNKVFVVGLEYRNVQLDIQDPVPVGFDRDAIRTVHRIEGYLGYTYLLSENWRIGMRAGMRINSNLQKEIMRDDLIYTASAFVINDRTDNSPTKPYRWIFGLDFSSTPGRSFPLPLVNYYREFHPDWTYTLGVPKTAIRHFLNTSHKDALQAFFTLDNFFSNIQDNFVIDGRIAQNVSMTIVVGGLGYEHNFTDHLIYYAYATHSVHNDFRLRDDDRNTIYTINDDNTFYFRSGIKFKF